MSLEECAGPLQSRFGRLPQLLWTISSSVVCQIAEGKERGGITVTADMLEDILGVSPVYFNTGYEASSSSPVHSLGSLSMSYQRDSQVQGLLSV